MNKLFLIIFIILLLWSLFSVFTALNCIKPDYNLAITAILFAIIDTILIIVYKRRIQEERIKG